MESTEFIGFDLNIMVVLERTTYQRIAYRVNWNLITRLCENDR